MNASSWADLLREARERAGVSQRELAARAGVAQSVVGRLEAGLSQPNVSTVERLIAAAGFQLHAELRAPAPADPVIAEFKRDIDRTLLRENLRKTPEQRVRSLQSLARLAREAQRAGAKLRHR